MHVDDCLKATKDFLETPTEVLDQVPGKRTYNVAAMSFTPRSISEVIRQHYPDFQIKVSHLSAITSAKSLFGTRKHHYFSMMLTQYDRQSPTAGLKSLTIHQLERFGVGITTTMRSSWPNIWLKILVERKWKMFSKKNYDYDFTTWGHPWTETDFQIDDSNSLFDWSRRPRAPPVDSHLKIS